MSLWVWFGLTLAVAFLAVAGLVVDEVWRAHR